MPNLLHSCMTKAIKAEGDQLRTGLKWALSRRGLLKLFDDHLECGNWRIPYSDIREAVLSSFRSPVLRIPGCLLKVRTDGATYQFGLNGWGRFWRNELPFPVRREQARLRLSPISVIARVFLAGYLIYLGWTWISPGAP